MGWGEGKWRALPPCFPYLFMEGVTGSPWVIFQTHPQCIWLFCLMQTFGQRTLFPVLWLTGCQEVVKLIGRQCMPISESSLRQSISLINGRNIATLLLSLGKARSATEILNPFHVACPYGDETSLQVAWSPCLREGPHLSSHQLLVPSLELPQTINCKNKPHSFIVTSV